MAYPAKIAGLVKDIFLRELESTGSVTKAARAAGISYRGATKARERVATFAAECASAMAAYYARKARVSQEFAGVLQYHMEREAQRRGTG